MKHVFIGYDANSKGYKLYNPSNGKIVVSCDVKFDEEAIRDGKKMNKAPMISFHILERKIKSP